MSMMSESHVPPSEPQYYPQPVVPQGAYQLAASNLYNPVPQRAGNAYFTKQGAWGLWWLCGISFGIYYLFWYHRVNRELAAALGRQHEGWGQWWSQLIPFYSLFGLYNTAKALNDAHAAIGSPTRVSPFVAWFWTPAWFASQTRYLQRRVNLLADMHHQMANAQAMPAMYAR